MSVYDFKVKAMDGETVDLELYKGKVLLIINSATACGFTPQYDELQALYEEYNGQGFEVLDFPCNQFGNQASGSNEEIKGFCTGNFGVTFTMFSKVEVNGEGADPLFKYLKKEKKGLLGERIKWNFTKFLVDREGKVVKRYAPKDAPNKLIKDIEKLL